MTWFPSRSVWDPGIGGGCLAWNGLEEPNNTPFPISSSTMFFIGQLRELVY